MILFRDIYERAIKLFDDPDILEKYENDQAGFEQIMYKFLMLGKDKCSLPSAIADRLCEFIEPEGLEESFEGDGGDTYVLEEPVPNGGVGVDFSFKVGEEEIKGIYNSSDNSITFSRKINKNETCVVTWFFAGVFTSDFKGCFRSDFNMKRISNQLITILAYAIVSVWADGEVDRVLEIRNILTDSDFKMYSPANSAKAKVEWRDQINKDLDTLCSSLNWEILATPKGGSRFGK